MGFAFDDDAGLPVIVPPHQHINGQLPPPPLTLHVEPTAPVPPVAVAPSPLYVQPEAAPSPQVEIGDIMIQLQRYADDTAYEAEQRAHAVIAAAEEKAMVIIQQANESARNAQAFVHTAHAEAHAIIEQAHHQANDMASRTRPVIAPETLVSLSAAVEEFANTNRTLVNELTQLRQALAEAYTAGLEFQAPQPAQASTAYEYTQPVAVAPQQYLHTSAS